MPQTVLQVQNRALEYISALGTGQAASAEDIAAMEVSYAADLLNSLRVVDIRAEVADNGIDDGMAMALAEYCAGLFGTKFGMPKQEAMAHEERGLDKIRQIANKIAMAKTAALDIYYLSRRIYGASEV